jgi:hypothetical protein
MTAVRLWPWSKSFFGGLYRLEDKVIGGVAEALCWSNCGTEESGEDAAGDGSGIARCRDGCLEAGVSEDRRLRTGILDTGDMVREFGVARPLAGEVVLRLSVRAEASLWDL